MARPKPWSPGKGFQDLDAKRKLHNRLWIWQRYGNTVSRFVVVVYAWSAYPAWDGGEWTADELWTVDVRNDNDMFYQLRDKQQRIVHLLDPPDDVLGEDGRPFWDGVIIDRRPLPAELVRQRARNEAEYWVRRDRRRRKARRAGLLWPTRVTEGWDRRAAV